MLARYRKILFLLFCSTLLCSCDIDNPLEGKEKKERYDLPGNTIPESAIEQIIFLSDQNVIYGYWLSSNGERPGLTLIYFKGNSDSMDEIWYRISTLYELGINIFVFDYRGYGKSGGSRSFEGMKMDGETALANVLERETVNTDSLIYYSYSIGNIVAFHLATELHNPFTIIAESPLGREDTFRNPYHVDGNACSWLMNSEVDNIEIAQNLRTPVLIINGANNSELPYNLNGRLIFRAIPEPKQRIIVETADHDDIITVLTPVSYLNSLRKWFYYCSIF